MSKPGYPIWWDTTITIYNKFEDAQTNVITWYRHVITDCFWKFGGTTVQVGTVELDSKSITCRIPKDDRFLDKKDWMQVPNDQMANYFTISQGDIVVKGEIDDEIDEYTNGKHSTDLLAKYKAYQECMEISQYSNNTGIGRNNEHYLIRGL